MGYKAILSIVSVVLAAIAAFFLGRRNTDGRGIQSLKDGIDTGKRGNEENIKRAGKVEDGIDSAAESAASAIEHLDRAESILDAAEKRSNNKGS